ncbi:unnamed protein product, partial [Polarella glacialis]
MACGSDVSDPFDHGLADLCMSLPGRDDQRDLAAMGTLGLMWQGANVAGFGLVHVAFRHQLQAIDVVKSCEQAHHWERFTSDTTGSSRAAVDSLACHLRYWDVICPQLELRGFCEAGVDCPFACTAEELCRHPAVLDASTTRRSQAKAYSFVSRFGVAVQKAVMSPEKWACNTNWWKFSRVSGVHVSSVSPLVEVEVQHGTMGPGRSGATELRYLILPSLANWKVAHAAFMWQMPMRATLKPPKQLQSPFWKNPWKCLKQRVTALCSRQPFFSSGSFTSKQASFLELAPSSTLRRVLLFLDWGGFTKLQASSSQFLRFAMRWQDGRWRMVRDSDCVTTQHIALALQARRGLR